MPQKSIEKALPGITVNLEIRAARPALTNWKRKATSKRMIFTRIQKSFIPVSMNGESNKAQRSTEADRMQIRPLMAFLEGVNQRMKNE